MRQAQEQKLQALKKQQEIHTRLAAERQIFLRDRKIKFFERRKIERRIRRLEKLHRASSSSSLSSAQAPYSDQLASLKQDLQYVMVCQKIILVLYTCCSIDLTININIKSLKNTLYLSIFNVQYFPKTEKYVPLFSGGDDSEIVDKRNGLRKQIEDRLTAAAASGKDLEGSFILSSIYTTNNIILLLVLTMLLTLIFQVLGSTCVSWALFKIGDWGPLD